MKLRLNFMPTITTPKATTVFREIFLILLLALCFNDFGIAQNLENGKEINATCAGCHGQHGQGGSRGEYPRIGGLSASYIASQLKAFRARTRVNIPMYPYTQERELPDQDIKDIAAYLASIELPTKWPVFKETDDALARLTLTERVMIIPRVPGDVDNGGAIYQKKCATCHAKTGMGRGMFPMLVGQYTSYLKRQMEKYLAGERPHDDVVVGGVLSSLKEEDRQDILAYLTSIQDQQ
ncbi:MAG: c-type cytochrome [Sulfuritalea sp.]|nr:c-type cytochrome [Sulfuritalea sp.]